MLTIHEMKELEILETPVLLFDCELRNGQHQYWATHQVTFEGNLYDARLIEHTGFDIKAYSEDGIDTSAKVSVVLANADSRYSQVERGVGFKGSRMTARFVFVNLATGAASTEAITIFRGIGNSPDQIREATFQISFNNRLNFQRVLLPEVRIQKRCPWLFPATQANRIEAITGGPRASHSPFFRCGYSAGEPGGVGNLNGTAPFTNCDYTRKSCEERGMFSQDSLAQSTRRFGGVEFVPSTTLVRGYGDKSYSTGAVQTNEAKYNDFVPLVYGTCWVQPPITLARNDGNLTRMEALLTLGEIRGVLKVVVNDVEIPMAVEGSNMTSTGWYHLVSRGNRTGAFNLNFIDGNGEALGNPYGSMAFVSVVVPNRVQDGRSIPRVQVLVEGAKLPTYDADGEFVEDRFTNNPAWVMLDVLKRSGWREDEIDLSSFGSTALYCADEISAFDLHGNPVMIPRFQCNLALRRRRSAAEVVRGIRNCAGLFLTFGVGGKLQLRQETTLGVQQAQAPQGTNAVEPLLGGWPAYEFDESSIVRGANGEPKLRIYSRSSADTPNRFSVEFQDSFNEYQQDSLSLLDLDDVVNVGQETSAAMLALGLANFDQATRMTKLQLLKSVRGNVYLEFETSVKAIGLKPGDLVTMTYLKEGMDRQLFRIIRVTPGSNFRTVQLSLQRHDDDWYVETAGNGAESSGRQPRYELGIPRPLVGNVLDEDGIPQFEIAEAYAEGTDGTARVEVSVGFTEPTRPEATKAGIPLLALSPLPQATGGSLRSDQVLYYALTGLDTEGRESAPSFIVRAVIPAGTATNRVTLNGLSFGSGTASFHVYRGVNSHQLARIASNQGIAAAYSDVGEADGFISPPDENFSHANFYWRLELQGERTAGIVNSRTIGNPGLNMLVNEWRSKTVRIVSGSGVGQEKKIESNSNTTCVLSAAWAVMPDATSKWAVVEPSWVSGATTATSPAVFEIPNREGATVQVTGRAANANGRESFPDLSPVTRWRILGASATQLDVDVAPTPTFSMTSAGDGTIEVHSIGFPSLVNTRTISAGTLVMRYWNELQSPSSLFLSQAIDDITETIVVSIAGRLSVGQMFQVDGELLVVTAVSAGGDSVQAIRGSHGSLVDTHEDRAPVYPLDQITHILPFGRDFFGSPASGSFSFNSHLPGMRVAAAELYLTNGRGNSEVARRSVTGTVEYGLRTLQGGQISLQVEGWLAIQEDATPPFIVESPIVMRDIFAVVGYGPILGPIVLVLRQDEDKICTLTIPAGQTVSNLVGGFGLTPLRTGARLRLEIESVAQTAESTPGSDLTVTIRL